MGKCIICGEDYTGPLGIGPCKNGHSINEEMAYADGHPYEKCSDCGGELVTDDEREAGYCEPCIRLQLEEDAAYNSEQRLRDMEGYGNYEGPVTWP